MVMQVLDSPNFSKFDTSSIRGVSYGGAPAPPDLVRRIRAAWPIGQPSNGYGLTETSSVTSMNSGGDYLAKPESVGPPVPVCDVAIVPEDFTGDEPDASLPRGPDVRGELWIKGPNVVRGYWNRPDETAKTFTRGWLHSGDVARLDEDNFIYIVDRAKDMIIRGGENVYSVQVEAALFEHPAVADCQQVIGVPDPTLGEEVGAVIVLRPGAKVTSDELQLHVKARLAGFMVPTHIWFRSEPLPRNPQGKVLKREQCDELVPPAWSTTRERATLRCPPVPASGCRPACARRAGAGQCEQSREQRRVVGHRHGRREDAEAAPLLGVGAHLVPDALHQVVGQRAVGADDFGQVMGAQGAERVDLPEVLADGEVAERQVGGALEVASRSPRRTQARPGDPASKLATGSSPSRSPSKRSAPASSMVNPASMSGTQASS